MRSGKRSFRRMGRASSVVITLAGLLGATTAQAGNVLIVNGASTTSFPSTTTPITSTLQSQLTSRGNTVTVSDGVATSLSGYDQVWDLRFSNTSPLSASDQSQYLSFMQGGGNLFVMGENGGFSTRNNSVLAFISEAGGGSITLRGVRSLDAQTFSTNGGIITYDWADVANSAGTGKFMTTLPDGAGSAIAWETGDLTNAGSGALAVVFDVNFMDEVAYTGEAELLQQLLNLIESGTLVIVDSREVSATAQEDAVENTAPAEVRGSVRTLVAAIGTRLRQLRGSGGYRTANAVGPNSGVIALSGLSAGDGSPVSGIGVWSDYTYGNMRNVGSASAYKAHSNTLLFGADYVLSKDLVIGVAAGYETSHLSDSSQDNLRKGRGGLVSAYAGYLIRDWLQASAQASFARLNNDIDQTTVGGGLATGSNRTYRYVLAASLSAFQTYDDLTVTGTVGYNRAREGFSDYVSSDGAQVSPDASRLGQVQFGGEASYAFAPTGQAFLGAMWEWDHLSEGSGDPNGAVINAGVRYAVMEGMDLGFNATAQVLRQDERQYTLGANLRYQF